MLTHLRASGVLVPDPAVLERIGLAARARARQGTLQLLGDGITQVDGRPGVGVDERPLPGRRHLLPVHTARSSERVYRSLVERRPLGVSGDVVGGDIERDIGSAGADSCTDGRLSVCFERHGSHGAIPSGLFVALHEGAKAARQIREVGHQGGMKEEEEARSVMQVDARRAGAGRAPSRVGIEAAFRLQEVAVVLFLEVLCCKILLLVCLDYILVVILITHASSAELIPLEAVGAWKRMILVAPTHASTVELDPLRRLDVDEFDVYVERLAVRASIGRRGGEAADVGGGSRLQIDRVQGQRHDLLRAAGPVVHALDVVSREFEAYAVDAEPHRLGGQAGMRAEGVERLLHLPSTGILVLGGTETGRPQRDQGDSAGDDNCFYYYYIE